MSISLSSFQKFLAIIIQLDFLSLSSSAGAAVVYSLFLLMVSHKYHRLSSFLLFFFLGPSQFFSLLHLNWPAF